MTGLTLALCLAAAQTAAAQNGMLQPGAATYSVAASGGSITIPITRVAGSTGIVGCSYTTVDGTAVQGTDYVTATGTLSWPSGNTAPQNVVITIKNAGLLTGSRVFYLQLSAPTGGAYLGVPPTTPATNQEGRVLGTTPAIAAPVNWNDPGGAGDSILQTLQILPANNPWNEDIRGLAVSPDSATIIGGMGASTHIHVNRDMNLSIVPGSQATKSVNITMYPGESDPGPYPVPDNLPIEGYLGDDIFSAGRTRSLAEIQQDINPTLGGDRHATIIDPVNGYITEFWQMISTAAFSWTASDEATFNMNSNTTRQAGWTSSDAAGLPILPSITRYDECQRGMVEHALRFTANSRADYVWPATHFTGSYSGTDRPRMGERFRLQNSSSVNTKIAAMHTHPKAIALALQKYGMFMADNGSTWYLSTNSDDRLTNLNDLQTLLGSDFDVVVTTGPNEGPRATSTAAITVTFGAGGPPPTLTVTLPTGAPTFSTSSTPLVFSGTASSGVGIASVSWTNSAGGLGTASGTTTWSASIALSSGTNTITVTAHDTGGNTTSNVTTVTYTPPPPGSPSSGGGGGGGGGGCGLSGLEILPLLLLRRLFRR